MLNYCAMYTHLYVFYITLSKLQVCNKSHTVPSVHCRVASRYNLVRGNCNKTHSLEIPLVMLYVMDYLIADVQNTQYYSIHSHYLLCLQVTPPESMTPRLFHSITATSLGPGLTEVLVFGGSVKWPLFKPVADLETTILRFGE